MIRDYYNSTVSVRRFSSIDKWGAITYAAAASLPCRRLCALRLARDAQGESITSSVQLVFSSDVVFDIRDKFDFPEPIGSVSPIAITTDTEWDDAVTTVLFP